MTARPRWAAASGARNTTCVFPPTARWTRSTRCSAWRGSTPAPTSALDAALARIQNDLFDVEADLCLAAKGPGGARMTITDAQVQWLEQQIDHFNADLAPLRSFILPGGSSTAAHLHLARTVCRRAERLMVELNDQSSEGVTPAALKYVNRLSDFLFVAGRHANDKGASDVLWQPGQNR
jgi:cob(I)alamin adenosyltransferase